MTWYNRQENRQKKKSDFLGQKGGNLDFGRQRSEAITGSGGQHAKKLLASRAHQ